MTKSREALKKMFRDWFNNFLTIGCFAEYYEMTEAKALRCIERGRKYHNADHRDNCSLGMLNQTGTI